MPSEKAFAYKMKAEALAHKGYRTDLTSVQVAPRLATEQIAEDAGTSKDTIKRYIRLTNLIPEILKYFTRRSAEVIDNTPLCYIPKQITVSEEINGTIYDVTGVFKGEVNKSLFQQLKELILSEQLL